MSMLMDIKSIFRKSFDDGVLKKEQAVQMYMDVLCALEWEPYDFDYDSDNEQKEEYKFCENDLFPEIPMFEGTLEVLGDL